MKIVHGKFLRSAVALILSLLLLAGNISVMATETEIDYDAIYGTTEAGTTTVRGEQKVAPTEQLMNGDFSEGLKYWGNYDANGKAIADESTVSTANGYLDLNVTTAWKGVSTVLFKLPVSETLVGKKLTIVLKAKSIASIQANISQVSITDGSNISPASTKGNLKWIDAPAKDGEFGLATITVPSTAVALGTFSTNMFWFAIQATAASTNIAIDDIKVCYVNDDGVTYTDIYTGDVYAPTSYLGGTEEIGVVGKTTDSKTQVNVPNGDFSEGLKYWGTTDTSGTAKLSDSVYGGSLYTEDNGNKALKITYGGTTWKRITTVPFTIEGLKPGDEIGVKFEYKLGDCASSDNGKPAVNLYYSNNGGSWSSGVQARGNADTRTVENDWISARSGFSSSALFLTITDDHFDEDGNCTIKFYLSVCFGDAPSGTYMLFDNFNVINKASGTDTDGIYNSFDKIGDTITAVSEDGTIPNGDISSGLRYWMAKADANRTYRYYASDFAEVVNGTLHVTPDSTMGYSGLFSSNFTYTKVRNDMDMVVLFDRKSVDGKKTVDLALLADSTVMTGSAVAVSETTADGWTTYRLDPGANQANATFTSATKFRLQLQSGSAGTEYETYFDNFRLAYIDNGGFNKLLVATDGSPIDAQYGDANNDGAVGLKDLVCAKKHMAEIEDNKIYLAAANVDKDADITVNAGDLVVLRQYLLGEITEF